MATQEQDQDNQQEQQGQLSDENSLSNQFSGGLNKDFSILKDLSNVYVDAHNITLTSNINNKFGAVSNIRGAKLLYSLENSSILGYCELNNFIILFVKSIKKDSTILDNNINYKLDDYRIYLLKYIGNSIDEVSGTSSNIYTFYNVLPEEADNNTIFRDYRNNIIHNDTLKYIYGNNSLNWGTVSYIKALSKIDIYNNINIYFCDDVNTFKRINLFGRLREPIQSGDVVYNYIDSSFFDIINDYPLPDIEIQSVSDGGELYVGMVQYTYRLYNDLLYTTRYSNPSQLVSLTNSSIQGKFSAKDYKGSPKLINGSLVKANKSVSLRILGLDNTVYNRIDIVRIQYSELNGLPEITTIVSNAVIQDIEYTYIDDGRVYNDTSNSLTLDDITIDNRQLFSARDIVIKNNIVFAVNIKDKVFEVLDTEYDARAFRYTPDKNLYFLKKNTSGEFVPEKIENINTIKVQDDCICPYNDYYSFKYQYNDYRYRSKFQKDGKTLGGEGKNIKYSFHVLGAIEDGSMIHQSEMDCQVGKGIFKFDDKTISNSQYDYSYDFSKDYQSLSTAGMSNIRSFMRDEIYRFGIVFYDKKARPSNVLWIADIKMPTISEFPLGNYWDIDGNKNYKILSNYLTIKFEVNIPDDLKSKISGFQIVRAERTLDNSTIAYQGLHGGLSSVGYIDLDKKESLFFMPAISLLANTEWMYLNADLLVQDIPTVNKKYQLTESDTVTGEASFLKSGAINYKIGQFISPEISYGVMQNTIKPLRLSNDSLIRNVAKIRNNSIKGYLDILVFAKASPNYSYPLSYFKITSYDYSNNLFYSSKITNIQYSIEEDLTINKNNSNLIIDGYIDSMYVWYNDTPSILSSFTGIGTGACLILNTENGIEEGLCNIYTKLENQYGGNTYYQRNDTEYIIASKIYLIDKQIPTNKYIANAQYGDVNINMYDHILSYYKHPKIDNFFQAYRMYNACSFLCESRINLQLITGKIPSKEDIYTNLENRFKNVQENQGYSDADVVNNNAMELKDFFSYNNVYSQENNLLKFYPKHVNLINSINQYNHPYQIIWSEREDYLDLTYDPWSIFSKSNYKNVNSVYGELNWVTLFENKVIFAQDTGVGILNVEEQMMQKNGDSTQSDLILGVGGIGDRFNYLSTNNGSKHIYGKCNSKDILYFYDYINHKLIIISTTKAEILSDTKGLYAYTLNNYIKYDSTFNELDVIAEFNNKTGEALFTFKKKTMDSNNLVLSIDYKTVKFNEILKTFISIDSQKSDMYINHNGEILYFSKIIDKKFNTHLLFNQLGCGAYGYYPEYQGKILDSTITFIINKYFDKKKVFDSLKLNLDYGLTVSDNFTNIPLPVNEFKNDKVLYKADFSTSYESAYNIHLIYDNTYLNNSIRFLEGYWNLQIPKDYTNDINGYGKMMRDKFLKITFYFDNSKNKCVILYNVLTNIRKSIR